MFDLQLGGNLETIGDVRVEERHKTLLVETATACSGAGLPDAGRFAAVEQPVLPKPSGCSPSFFSFVFTSSDSCFLRSSTIFSNFLIRSSRAFSSAITSNGVPPRRQAEMAPMIARRFMAFLRVENVIAIRSQLLSQKKLALPERDDVGCHDFEIHGTADGIHRG